METADVKIDNPSAESMQSQEDKKYFVSDDDISDDDIKYFKLLVDVGSCIEHDAYDNFNHIKKSIMSMDYSSKYAMLRDVLDIDKGLLSLMEKIQAATDKLCKKYNMQFEELCDAVRKK